jgi:hypothetical protein
LNGLQKTVLKRVVGAHLGVLLLLLFIPWIKGCFHPKPKEIITFIDLASMPAPPEPAPIPEPVPPPIAKPIPEPPKTNAPPKVVKKESKKIKPAPALKKPELKKAVSKPVLKKTEAERLAAIRQNNRVTIPTTQPAPSLDFSGIQSALNRAASAGSGSGSGGAYDPLGWYYAQVNQQIYSIWQQPASAPEGLTATACVGYKSDGTVLSRTITTRSGNTQFDLSIQTTLNMITRLPIPIPSGVPNPIEIKFVLSSR